MKKIEAYQASDGKKFLIKPEALRHEEKIKYKAKIKEIGNYLYDLLGINGIKDDEDKEDQLCNILKEAAESDICYGIISEAIELGGLGEIIDLIADFAMISDGALLKTAQYAREIIQKGKKGA